MITIFRQKSELWFMKDSRKNKINNLKLGYEYILLG